MSTKPTNHVLIHLDELECIAPADEIGSYLLNTVKVVRGQAADHTPNVDCSEHEGLCCGECCTAWEDRDAEHVPWPCFDLLHIARDLHLDAWKAEMTERGL